MNTFLKGTFILAGAAFAGELIEFLVNMVLARELGREGMGMYMTVLPIIFLPPQSSNIVQRLVALTSSRAAITCG